MSRDRGRIITAPTIDTPLWNHEENTLVYVLNTYTQLNLSWLVQSICTREEDKFPACAICLGRQFPACAICLGRQISCMCNMFRGRGRIVIASTIDAPLWNHENILVYSLNSYHTYRNIYSNNFILFFSLLLVEFIFLFTFLLDYH